MNSGVSLYVESCSKEVTMSVYRVKLDCDKCASPFVVTTLFVGADWQFVCNLECPNCKRTGHCELEICELIARAREADGALLT
jgi:hypothetical protein